MNGLKINEVDEIFEDLKSLDVENDEQGFTTLYAAYNDLIGVAQYYRELYNAEFKSGTYVPDEYWDKDKKEYKADPEMAALMGLIIND